MEFLDRYIQAVRSYLPKRQQDDIARELRENILAKMEDKASELGRPLNESEQESLIRDHGHPMIVASRYSRDPHPYVIGPAIYPAYRMVLRVALPIVVLIRLAVAVAMILTGTPPVSAIGSFWADVWLSVLFALGVITAVFALIDRNQPALFAKWDPRKLPRVRKETRQVSRLASIAELVMLSIAVAWWLSAPHYLGAIFESGEISFLGAGPGLLSLYIPFTILILLRMVQPLVNLFQPHWARFRLAARTVTACLSAIVFSISLRRGDWIVLADPADASEAHHRLVALVNHWTKVGIAIVVAAVAVEVLVRLWRLGREWRNGAHGDQAPAFV